MCIFSGLKMLLLLNQVPKTLICSCLAVQTSTSLTNACVCASVFKIYWVRSRKCICLPVFSVLWVRHSLRGRWVVTFFFVPWKELKSPNARNQNVQDGPTSSKGNLSERTWKSWNINKIKLSVWSQPKCIRRRKQNCFNVVDTKQ